MANTLAYYDTTTIITVKGIIVQAPGASTIKHQPITYGQGKELTLKVELRALALPAIIRLTLMSQQ